MTVGASSVPAPSSVSVTGTSAIGAVPFRTVARSIQDPFAVAVGEVEVLPPSEALPDTVVETAGTFTMSWDETSSVDTPDPSGDPALTDTRSSTVSATATLEVTSCRFDPEEGAGGGHGTCTGRFTSSSWSSTGVTVDKSVNPEGMVVTDRSETTCMRISGGGGGPSEPATFGRFFVDGGHAYLQVTRPGFLLECTTVRTFSSGGSDTTTNFPSRSMGNLVAGPPALAGAGTTEPYFDMHMLPNGAMVGGGADFSGTFPATFDLRPIP